MEIKNSRDSIAINLIIFSFSALIVISLVYFYTADEPENLFDALLPLISTWVGTVLAFYFGRENFEAASNRYQDIINKLSPELLATVKGSQVMIDKYTMVTLQHDDIRLKPTIDLAGLIKFLDEINKTRLPIMEGAKIKYIIHKSVLTEELAKVADADKVKTFDQFLAKYPYIEVLGKIREEDSVEVARNLLKNNNLKDVFILDKEDNVLGWLTDTQILRYLNNNKS